MTASEDSRGSSAGWDRVDRLLFSWLAEPSGVFDERLEELRRDDPDLAGALEGRLQRMRRIGWMFDDPSEPVRPAAGRVLGDYQILSLLGTGGMGEVYLAEQKSLGRRVALKVIRPDHLRDPRARDRFQREARVVAGLRHPGICAVFDVGEVDGQPYLAMQHVEGETLAERLAARRSRVVAAGVPGAAGSGPPSSQVEIGAMLELIEKVARALHEAHEAGVVHRDVKPGNVMVDRRGEPVVLDFGLARVDAGEGAAELTLTGDLVGTPAYMSPEQVRPRGRTIDRRTDVFSLGVVLFESLTLERPFFGASQAELYERIERDATPDPRRSNPALPVDVVAILAKAMEKEPARRYATALELADDVARLRRREPVRAKRIGAFGRGTRWARRNPAASALIVVLAAGLATSAVLLRLRATAMRSLRATGLVGASVDAMETHPMRALLLARAAHETEATAETLGQLERAWSGVVTQRQITADQGGVWGAWFSPDGTRIITRGADRRALLLDHEGVELRRLGDGSAKIWASTFSTDGRSRVLVGGENGRIFVSDRDGNPLGEPLQNPVGMGCAVFTADGEHVLTGGLDGVVRMLALDGSVVRTFGPVPESEVAFKGVVHLEVSGRWLVASDYPGFVTVWDLEGDGQPIDRIRHTDGVLALSRLRPGARADPPTVAIVPRNGDPWLWLPRSGERPVELRGHAAMLYAGAWSPDGARLVTCGWEHAPIVWSAEGELLCRLEGALGGVWCAVFDTGGRVLTASMDGAARLHDARGRLIGQLRAHSSSVDTVDFSSDGRLAVTASQDDTVVLWDLAQLGGRVLAGHFGDVVVVEPLLDGGALCAALDGSLWQWDASGHGRELVAPLRGQLPTGLAVASDGTIYFASRSQKALLIPPGGGVHEVLTFDDEIAALWPCEGGFLTVTWGTSPLDPAIEAWARRVDAWERKSVFTFDDRGRIAATHTTADLSEILVVWPGGEHVRVRRNGEVFEEIGRGRFEGGPVSTAGLSADGSQTLVCHHDGTVRIVRTGRPDVVLLGHESQVSSASFSPDGDRILTTSRDGTVALWDAHGVLEREVRCDAGPAHIGMFTPDGTRVLIGYADGTARYWFADGAAVVAAANSAATREFTVDERARFAELLGR